MRKVILAPFVVIAMILEEPIVWLIIACLALANFQLSPLVLAQMHP